jgi:hypothetical protein
MDRCIDALRWAMLILPIYFAQPHIVHAEEASTYVEIIEEDVEYSDAAPLAPRSAALAQFGPFRVVADGRVELVDAIEADTPAAFRRLLAAYPGVRQIDMVECPGSEDDDANLELARMVRARGIATHVPAGGSIRSGGVELFLAGVTRTIAKGAEIGVHAWADSDGMQATDYAPGDAVHRPYLSFYADMGMKPELARAFYDFTNRAAPFEGLHVMTGDEIARFGLVTGS